MPGMRGPMATAALVWLGQAIAGEKGRLEESVAGLSLFDIEQIPDGAASTAVVEVTPDPPTQPGSVPAIVVEPVPQVVPPSPGVTYPDQSPSTSSSSATSGPGDPPQRHADALGMFWCLMVDQAPSWLEMSFGRRISLQRGGLAADKDLTFRLFGRDVSASKALQGSAQAQQTARQVEASSKAASASTIGLGVAL